MKDNEEIVEETVPPTDLQVALLHGKTVVNESKYREFITYCYRSLTGQRITAFCKRVENKLLIKIYTLHPKEQFCKRYVKDYHKEYGYFSLHGILHVVPCISNNYKKFFFEVLDKHYVLDEELLYDVIFRESKKVVKEEIKEEKKIEENKPKIKLNDEEDKL